MRQRVHYILNAPLLLHASWHGSSGVAKSDLMEELPWIIDGYSPYILRRFRAPEVEQPSICSVTGGTPGIEKLFALGSVGRLRLLCSIVNVLGLVYHRACLEEGSQSRNLVIVKVGIEVVVGVCITLKYSRQISCGFGRGRAINPRKASQMRTFTVGAILAFVIPAMTFLASPGIAAGPFIGSLSRPNG